MNKNELFFSTSLSTFPVKKVVLSLLISLLCSHKSLAGGNKNPNDNSEYENTPQSLPIQGKTLKEEELNNLKQRAGNGDREARYELGKYMYNKEIRKQDNVDMAQVDTAIAHLKIAAEEGHLKAKKFLEPIYGNTIEIRSNTIKPLEIKDDDSCNNNLLSNSNANGKLDLSGKPIDDFKVNTLANDPKSSGLKILNLKGTRLRDDRAKTIIKSPYLSNLTDLNLSSNELGKDTLIHFGNKGKLTNIQELDLSGNSRIGDEGVKYVPSFPFYLRALSLDQVSLTDEGIWYIASSSNLSQVVKLSLNHNSITSRGVGHLFSSRILSNGLIVLNLDGNRIDDNATDRIKNSRMLRQLRELSLKNAGGLWRYKITEKGADDLASAAVLSNLMKLDLADNAVKDKGVEFLAKSPYLKNLQDLNLSGNEIGDMGAIELATLTHLPLTRLELSKNFITKLGAKAILNSMLEGSLSGIREINLRNNRLDNETKELFKKIAEEKQIKVEL